MPKTNGHPTYQEVLALFDRTDRQIAELREQALRSGQETDRRLKDLSRQVGKLTNGWGETIEGLASPSTAKALRKEGFEINTIQQNTRRQLNGGSMEIDVLLLGKSHGKPAIFIVEIRTRLRPDDVEWLKEQIERFPKFFPEYKGWEKVGILCGVKISEGIEHPASKAGFYVMAPSDDGFAITARPHRT